ncbi:MAG TPA: phosphodiester glycosidase family protein [Candidatus Eisenbacteria bacterium]|jgi:hypothetical protein
MASRRLPVGRIAALAALLAAALVFARGGTGLHWKALRPGLEFTTLSGGPYCRRGSSRIALLRLDPARVSVRVHHFGLAPERRPLDVVEWQRVTHADAVFNAGQFLPDWSYMGLLVCGGQVVSSRLHPTFKAALVAGPLDGGSAARVLDLEREPLEPDHLRWREVAQSFMLLDRSGRIRVRQSDKVANRTAVGEDRRGRLVVFTTEGGYTLDDLAHLIKGSPLQISHAMAMDGGNEAQLCVAVGSFRYASLGGRTRAAAAGEPADAPLPAVISVSAP